MAYYIPVGVAGRGGRAHDADTGPLPITDDVKFEGESEAFIPYPPIGERLEHIPINVRPEVHYYISRMAFLPNAIKLYLHNPWSAEHLIRLNNAVMRSEQGSLSEEFKYRLAFVASRDNECTYCTAHHAATLKRRFNYSEDDLSGVLSLDQADRRARGGGLRVRTPGQPRSDRGDRRDAPEPGRTLHPRRGHGDHTRDRASGRCTTRCTLPWECLSRTRLLTRRVG